MGARQIPRQNQKMKTRPLFQNRRTHLGAVLTTAAALLLLGSVNPAFAKKGGGGKPGGEDPPPDPDPVEVPFRYQITWHEAEFSNDIIDLSDVASDGTVVGRFKPDGVYGSNIAFIRFPDGSNMNLEDLLIEENEVAADSRVTYAYRICDGLLLGIDIYASDGRMYCGALKLNPDGTFVWFTAFEGLGGKDTILLDATEAGEFLIATGDFADGPTGGISFGGSTTLSVWDPAAGTTLTLPGPVEGGQAGWFYASSISDNGTAFLGGSLYDYVNGNFVETPTSDTTLTPVDLGDDGTAIAAIAGAQIKRNRWEPSSFARWIPGTAQWETIISSNSLQGKAYANGSGEIAGSTGGGIFVFHDDYGLQSVNDMILPSQVSQWNSGASFLVYGISDPIQDAPYSGVILGRESGGSYFTLTPVVD
jgi:hypothetical protein